MAANLLVIQGPDNGSRFDLSAEPVTIGRGVQNDLRLNDAEVSRVHFRIQKSDSGFDLLDAGSANGTLVNGRVAKTHALRNGDQVQIGRTVLVFENDEDSSRMKPGAEVQFTDEGASEQSQIVRQIGPDDTQTFVWSELELVDSPAPTRLTGLQTLYRISEEAANATISMQQMLQTILDLTLAATDADHGCVLLRESDSGLMKPEAFAGRADEDSGPLMVSRTIVNQVVAERRAVRTSDAQADVRFADGHSVIASGIREAICVPMTGLADFIGVIYLDTTRQPDSIEARLSHTDVLTDEHLKLALAIGRQAAIAVERRRYQEALVKAERFAAVGQTITVLSHHVKNILQGIRGGSYLIETGLSQSDNEVVRQGWGIVDRNQDRIYNLVMDMLTYSTEKKPALAMTSLNDVVGEVCDLMKGRAAEYKVELRFEPDNAIPLSGFDSHGIHRAVLNVVTNAIDAVEGSDGAEVRVQTALLPGRTLAISIHDNGPGIPEDQRASLFSLFESTKGARGTGLGLAVSRKIMNEHGGRIEVDSDGASGSTFRLLLPVLELAPE